MAFARRVAAEELGNPEDLPPPVVVPRQDGSLAAEMWDESRLRAMDERIADDIFRASGNKHRAGPRYRDDFFYGEKPAPVVSCGSAKKEYFWRIGHVYIMAGDYFRKLTPETQALLGANVIVVPASAGPHKDAIFQWDEFTLTTAIAMLHHSFAGVRAVDCGAGNGFLSVLALRLGAVRAELIENSGEAMKGLQQLMGANGIPRSRYRVHGLDYATHRDRMVDVINATSGGDDVAVLSNVGNWSEWTGSNTASFTLGTRLRGFALFVAGGYSFVIGEEDYTGRDEFGQARSHGFEPLSARAIAVLPGGRISAWSAVRRAAVAPESPEPAGAGAGVPGKAAISVSPEDVSRLDGPVTMLDNAHRSFESGASGDALLDVITSLEAVVTSLDAIIEDGGAEDSRFSGAAKEKKSDAADLLERAEDRYDRWWASRLQAYAAPGATYSGRTVASQSAMMQLIEPGETIVDIGIGGNGAPTFRELKEALDDKARVRAVEFIPEHIPPDLEADVAQGNVLTMRPGSRAAALIGEAKVIRICNLVTGYFDVKQRERLLRVLGDSMREDAYLIISNSAGNAMRDQVDERGFLYRKVGGVLSLHYYLTNDPSDVPPQEDRVALGGLTAFPVLSGSFRVPDGLWPEGQRRNVHPAVADTPTIDDRSFGREVSDEDVLIRTAKHALQGRPVNEIIDVSLVPGKKDGLSDSEASLQLDAAMETIARMIVRYRAHGLDIRYAVTDAADPDRKAEAERMLKAKVSAIITLRGALFDAAGLFDLHDERDTVAVMLQDVASVQGMRIGDRTYPVGLLRDREGEGYCMPNYTAASAIGLSLAALRIAHDDAERSDADRNDYAAKERKMCDHISSIYTRYGIANFDASVLRAFVTFDGEARRGLAISFALPPIVKAAAHQLLEYHKALQLALQSA